LIVSPAIFDGGVAALDDACFAQAAAERRQLRRESARRCRSKHADGRHVGLLRARRERPCRRRATEQRDELASLHVWMAPAWQEKIERAAQRSLAVMCPACSRSPDGLLALMGSASRGLITRAGSMSQ